MSTGVSGSTSSPAAGFCSLTTPANIVSLGASPTSPSTRPSAASASAAPWRLKTPTRLGTVTLAGASATGVSYWFAPDRSSDSLPESSGSDKKFVRAQARPASRTRPKSSMARARGNMPGRLPCPGALRGGATGGRTAVFAVRSPEVVGSGGTGAAICAVVFSASTAAGGSPEPTRSRSPASSSALA